MATLYWGGGSGTWDATTTHWFTNIGRTITAGAAPTSADDVIFDDSSTVTSSMTISIAASYSATCKNMSLSVGAKTLIIQSVSAPYGNLTITGNLTLSPTMTSTGSGFVGFAGLGTGNLTIGTTSSNITLTTNNVPIAVPITFANSGSGSTTIVNTLDTTATPFITLSNASINFNNNSIYTGSVVFAPNTSNKLNFYNNEKIFVRSSGTVWNANVASTSVTVTGNGTINITNTSTFEGGGLNYSGMSLNIAPNPGPVVVTIKGNNTFTTILNSNSRVSTSLLFAGSSTQTVTSGLNLLGAPRTPVALGPANAGQSWTINSTAYSIQTNFINVAYGNVTGGSQYYAGPQSINGGNNTGWIFAGGPVRIENGPDVWGGPQGPNIT
jgi:hypothetical protein